MKNGKEKYKYFLKNYSLIFIPILLVIAISISQALSIFKARLSTQELDYAKEHLDIASAFVSLKVKTVISDLVIIGRDDDLVNYISNEDTFADVLLTSWNDALSTHPAYDEIRYLDINGRLILTTDRRLSSDAYRGFDFDVWGQYENFLELNDGDILSIRLPNGLMSLVKPVYGAEDAKIGYLMLSYRPEFLFKDLQGVIDIQKEVDYIIKFNEESNILINREEISVISEEILSPPNSLEQCNSQVLDLSDISSTGEKVNVLDKYSIIHCFTPGVKEQEVFPFIKYSSMGIMILAILGYGVFLNMKWHRESNYNDAIFLSNTLKIINKTLRHDVLNNITIIKFNLELMDSKNPLIGDIKDAVARTTEIVEDMRILEKNSLGNFFSTEVDLPKLIKEIVTEFRKDIHIRVRGEGTTSVDSAFNSVIENIIRNAITHAKANHLDIHISNDKEFVTIEFRDDGKGVPERLKVEIFEEGFKYGPTGHTGLGLFIVKTTVERYGGQVYVQDNLPKGANFIVKLPK